MGSWWSPIMRISDNDKMLIDYYQRLKRRKQLKNEIDILENSRKQLECYSMGVYRQSIINRINANKELLAKKNLEYNILLEDTLKIELIILVLDEEDKEICDMRFNKQRDYQAIGESLCLSKSTVCRKVKGIINKISKELE